MPKESFFKYDLLYIAYYEIPRNSQRFLALSRNFTKSKKKNVEFNQNDYLCKDILITILKLMSMFHA